MNRLSPLLVVIAVCTLVGSHLGAQSENRIRRSNRPIADRYIVVLRDLDDPEGVGRVMAALHRGRLRHVYNDALRGFAVQVPEAAARAIANDPRVAFVEEDSAVTTAGIQTGAPWGLDRIDQRALPLSGEYQHTREGIGVHVHVLDTGIRVTHAEFGGRALIAADYIDDDGDGDPSDIENDDGNTALRDGYDCHGHGTHVAGTIGALTYGVAKSVTLWAHRVLNCSGTGTSSAVIAALDRVVRTSARPAVVNLSLTGGTSLSLDAAVGRAIAEGVTVTIAAGNGNVDASTTSPARVVEAITVGATTSTDTRASYSNFGSSLDLFAPGSSIVSTSWSGDFSTKSMSGTSMATPHVAGAAALYLEAHPDASPADVREALVAAATPGVIVGAGPGSPNLLLHVAADPRDTVETLPTVSVVGPNGGEKVFTGAPSRIRWTADDPDGLARIDVEFSIDRGTTFAPVPGCTGLSGALRECVWISPGPATAGRGRIRVTARDTVGDIGSDMSDATFTVVSGTPSITVTHPYSAVNWGRGSRQQLRWTHNLASTALVDIDVSYDGGTTHKRVASSVPNSGLYEWTVAGPNTATALLRVSSTDGPVSSSTKTTFSIADPFVTLSLPAAGTSVGYGTWQEQKWATNLGPSDLVTLQLSTDGGATFPFTLAPAVTATQKQLKYQVPALSAATSAARIRLVWSNAPTGGAVGVNPGPIRVEPPFVRVMSPNGGEVWKRDSTVKVTWVHNLGPFEAVRIDLSPDAGVTFPFSLASSTPSDGTHAVPVLPTWSGANKRVRVTSLSWPQATDMTDGTFSIQ